MKIKVCLRLAALTLSCFMTAFAFAEDEVKTYRCTSGDGVIVVASHSGDNAVATVDFSEHPVSKQEYFKSSYLHLVGLEGVESNYRTGAIKVHFDPANFSSDAKNPRGDLWKGYWYVNNSSELVAESYGSQDASRFKVHFSLNKNELTAKVRYRQWALFVPVGASDSLKCSAE